MRFFRSRLTSVSAALVLLGLGYVWFSDYRTENEWQEYVAKARSGGAPWSLSEIKPPPVPPEFDAARLPIFADTKKVLEGLPQFHSIRTLRLSYSGRQNEPQRIDWRETRKRFADGGLHVDPTEVDDSAAVDAALRPFQPVVDQLIQSKAVAANWGDDVWSVSNVFPHQGTAHTCNALLTMRANLDLALNRPEKARLAIEAQLRLARIFYMTPTKDLHSWLADDQDKLRETVWRGLDTGAWSDEDLRALATDLSKWNGIGNFVCSAKIERVFTRESIAPLIGKTDPPPTLSTSQISICLARLRASRLSWWRKNQLLIERRFDELISMVDAQAEVLNAGADLDDPIDRTDLRDQYLLAWIYMPPKFLLEPQLWAHAQMKMTGIACALETFRRAKGKYPATLDALVPDCISKLPVDPMNGQAFRYFLNPRGTYTLYSLGLDRIDQGGATEPGLSPSSRNLDWRCPTLNRQLSSQRNATPSN